MESSAYSKTAWSHAASCMHRYKYLIVSTYAHRICLQNAILKLYNN